MTKDMHMRMYSILVLALLLTAGAVSTAMGQGCGPACPVCSGKAVGDLLPPATVYGSALFIPGGEEETAVFNLRYGLFSWMDAGIGYGIDEEEFIWSVRLAPVSQDFEGWRPSLILGTGSVQAGGTDQSAFVLLGKTREIVEGTLGVGITAGYATDLPDFEEDWGLASAALTFKDRVSPFYTYDGINSHLGLSVFANDWLTLTGYYLEMEEAGIMAAIQWSPGGEEDE